MRRFNKDSVVCFLGDSITFNSERFRRVYEYYRPDRIPVRRQALNEFTNTVGKE